MLRKLAITTIFTVGVVSAAHADVYRWVDDHGGVHYSDQWVPGSEVIKSNRPHPTTTSANTDSSQRTPSAGSKPSNSSSSSSTDGQSAEKAVKQDLAKVREQQCKEAKDRYDKAIQARRIYKASSNEKSKDEDRPDDRQYMSDEEADAYRVQTRKDMDQFCGTSTK